jgi:uncharacterized protein (TIGR02444 family)
MPEVGGERTSGAARGLTLWTFSQAFYARPGVSEALIALQNRAGLDVNLILFALWCGISGRGRLSNTDLSSAERSAHPITTAIVVPLRALRRQIRSDPDADVQRLRERIKRLEIAAERIVQHRLARIAGTPANDTVAAARAAAAQTNLALYLGPRIGHSAEAARIREALDALLKGETETT